MRRKEEEPKEGPQLKHSNRRALEPPGPQQFEQPKREGRTISRVRLRSRSLWASSPVLRLVSFLSIGKAIVLVYLVLAAKSLDAVQLMAMKWDGGVYNTIAMRGYETSSYFVFSPIYPALISVITLMIGSTWVSSYLITNLMSFIFPLLLYKAYGYRTAFFAEMFPTYLLFGTIAYSDVIALVFIAGCLLLLMKDRISPASAAMSVAILTFFNLAWVLPSFLITLAANRRWRDLLLFYVLPVVTGGLIILWLNAETGVFLDFVKLESPWGVRIVNPITQAYYLLCPSGTGSFTCQPWEADGVFLPPLYWLLRNIAFESFYIFGAFYLLRTRSKHRVFLCVYCLSVTIPLLFLTGFVALSIPRLLLPAFPVFIGYSTLLRRYDVAYASIGIGLAAIFAILQYFAYFS